VGAVEHRGDLGRLRVGGRGGQPEAVRDGGERHPHLKFLGGPGRDPGADGGRLVQQGSENRRLADARLAGDEHDLSAPRPGGRYGGSQPLQLSVASYQRDLTSRSRPATSHMPSLRTRGPLRNKPAKPGHLAGVHCGLSSQYQPGSPG
jgi:hypothetical protein